MRKIATKKKNAGMTKRSGNSASIAPIDARGASLANMTDDQAVDLGARAEAIEQLTLLRNVVVPNSFSLKLYLDRSIGTLHVDGVASSQVSPSVPTSEGFQEKRFGREESPHWYDTLAHQVMAPFIDQALDAYREALAEVIVRGLSNK